MKLLVFAGSIRQNSFNRKLAQVTATLARASGAEVTHIELADFDIPMYNADLEAGGTPADVLRLKQILFEHPAWIICSPEYNGGYTALLKNTLDWASSPVTGHALWGSGLRPFIGKVVGLLSASPGLRGGLRSLEQLTPIILNSQCWLAPKRHSLASASQAFDEQGQLIDPKQREAVLAVVQQVLWAAPRLHPSTPT